MTQAPASKKITLLGAGILSSLVLIAAAPAMAVPVATTSSGPAMLGRTCRTTRRGPRAPRARAASIQASSRAWSTRPRTRRATPTQLVTENK